MKEWSPLLLLHCISYVTKVGLVSSACHMHRAVVVVVVIVPFLEFSTLALASKVQPKMIHSAGGVQVLLQMGGEVLETG